MYVEQTSKLVNAVVSAVKINPQDIASLSAVASSNHVDKRQQVQ
jgi:hypothetical protein